MADKTYILDLKCGGQRKVTVPEEWKVTFGPVAVGRGSGTNPQTGERLSGLGLALRFYEGTDKQRAIFTDVVGFRDNSIKIEERVKSTKQQTLYRDTPEGRKQVVVEASVQEWRDPDAPNDRAEEEFAALPDFRVVAQPGDETDPFPI